MEQHGIFFDNWDKVGRSLVLAVTAYLALVILLRLSGKRTLSKMNVFDFVFVVALGSTLATTILSADTTWTDGVMAFVALMGLQVLLSWLCVSSHRIDSIVNGEPELLMYKGKYKDRELKRHRVTREELRAAARNHGLATMAEVDSIVLETDGTFSVVWRMADKDDSAMIDVRGHPAFDPHHDRGAESS